jgi:hypothetical protein
MAAFAKNVEERQLILLAAAAVLLHADISNRGLPLAKDIGENYPGQRRVTAAFDFAEAFIAEAERRLGP